MGCIRLRGLVALLFLLLGLTVEPRRAGASDALQCVPYARVVSGVQIKGDALTWWNQAEGRYDRGTKPRKGAIMAFRPYGPMTLGHVAVVSRILNDREVLVRHANWSSAGAIEEDVLVRDVSEEGDWSAVRVWHGPTGQLGLRSNPLYGFIYPPKSRLHDFLPERDAGGARYAYLTPERSNAREVRMADGERPSQRAGRSAVGRGQQVTFIIEYAGSADMSDGMGDQSLADIVADVRRKARI